MVQRLYVNIVARIACIAIKMGGTTSVPGVRDRLEYLIKTVGAYEKGGSYMHSYERICHHCGGIGLIIFVKHRMQGCLSCLHDPRGSYPSRHLFTPVKKRLDRRDYH